MSKSNNNSPVSDSPPGGSTPKQSMEVTHDPWSLFTPTNTQEVDDIQQKIEEKLLKQLNRQVNPSKKFNLMDVAPFMTDGVEVLVEDEFTRCFTSPEINAWNWNIYLYPAWLFGLFIRYCILFPLRLTCLLIGAFIFAFMFISVSTLVKSEKTKKTYQRKCLRFLCTVFIMSWSGVIKYHGVRPLRKKNQIFVANHTTVMDVVVLQNQFNCASVGQKQKGLLGFIQTYLLSCIGCLWFDRAEAKDRMVVAQLISKHIDNEANDPILIFPEGVCVNNHYCVMFKKGAFDLPGVIIYPIAIKYNTLFVDAFWNSKKQSFPRHMFNLMTSWALVCDVWYLEPQTKRPDESSAQFANRVKAMIAKKAGIINVPWDGYLKYFKPSSRFAEHKQAIFASRFTKRFNQEANLKNENCDGEVTSSPTLESMDTEGIKQRKTTATPSNEGGVVEIYGASGTGKSECCLHIVAVSVMPKVWQSIAFGGNEIGVVYFDNDYKFDVYRFHRIVRANGTLDYNSEEVYEAFFAESMKRLHVIRCRDSIQFLVTLKNLHLLIKSVGKEVRAGNPCREIQMMVIDSVTAYYWLDKNGEAISARSHLPWVDCIAQIIAQYNLTVIGVKQALFATATNNNNNNNRDKDQPPVVDSKHSYFISPSWNRLVRYRMTLPNKFNGGEKSNDPTPQFIHQDIQLSKN
eukprot:gene18239-21823_t